MHEILCKIHSCGLFTITKLLIPSCVRKVQNLDNFTEYENKGNTEIFCISASVPGLSNGAFTDITYSLATALLLVGNYYTLLRFV